MYTNIDEDLHKLIVELRNRRNVRKNFVLFVEYVEQNLDKVLKYNSSWLTSVVDTYADYGNKVEKGNALVVSTLVAMVRLCGTYLGVFDETVFYKMVEMFCKKQEPLTESKFYSLMITRQDTLLNLQKRILRQMKETPVVEKLYLELMGRMLRDDTIFRKFIEIGGDPKRVMPLNALELEDNHGIV